MKEVSSFAIYCVSHANFFIIYAEYLSIWLVLSQLRLIPSKHEKFIIYDVDGIVRYTIRRTSSGFISIQFI